jgi:hypothetical protein
LAQLWRPAQALICESFLVLFYKKELLPSFAAKSRMSHASPVAGPTPTHAAERGALLAEARPTAPAVIGGAIPLPR